MSRDIALAMRVFLVLVTSLLRQSRCELNTLNPEDKVPEVRRAPKRLSDWFPEDKKAAVKAEAQAEATEAMNANGGRKRPRREGDEAEEAVAVDAAAAAAASQPRREVA